MRFITEFKKYKRSFVKPLSTAHGKWEFREGLIVRITNENTRCSGYGEICPLEDHGTETLDEAIDCLKRWDGTHPIPINLTATSAAIRHAKAMIDQNDDLDFPTYPVAKLLNMASIDFSEGSVLKLKIGSRSFRDEWAEMKPMLDSLVNKQFIKIRLDANGGLSSDEWEFWDEKLSPYKHIIEFLEQPLKAESWESIIEHSANKQIPVALDESVSLIPNLSSTMNTIFVLKMHNLQHLLNSSEGRISEELAKRIVLSSSFETVVGLWGALRDADNFGINHYALGYGVNEFFDDLFCWKVKSSNCLSRKDISRSHLDDLWGLI